MPKTFQDIKQLKKDSSEHANVGGMKQVKFAGFKVSPSRPTAPQLEKINQLTRRTFKADELYIGQMRLAHNAIDRDNERFSEEVIQRFIATAVRKTMLLDHDRSVKDSAAGKFFDVELEKVPLEQANAETGQNFKLPEGASEVQFLSPWFYIPIDAIDAKEIVKIDAGIYDWASIGFRAEKLVPVMDKEGKPLYWEYRGTGDETEMTEGSLVYLGAQPGAAVKSAAGPQSAESIAHSGPLSPTRERAEGEGAASKAENSSDANGGTTPDDHTSTGKTAPGAPSATTQKGDTAMNIQELLERLKMYFGRPFTEANVFDEIKGATEERIALAVEGAKKPLAEEIKRLQPLAEDGKTFRNSLVTEYVGLKVKLHEVSDKPENQTALKEVAAGYPIDFLKGEISLLKTRVYEKYPAEAQLTGGDFDKADGKAKSNPLIPKE